MSRDLPVCPTCREHFAAWAERLPRTPRGTVVYFHTEGRCLEVFGHAANDLSGNLVRLGTVEELGGPEALDRGVLNIPLT